MKIGIRRARQFLGSSKELREILKSNVKRLPAMSEERFALRDKRIARSYWLNANSLNYRHVPYKDRMPARSETKAGFCVEKTIGELGVHEGVEMILVGFDSRQLHYSGHFQNTKRSFPNQYLIASIYICNIEKDGTYQLQLDFDEWEDDQLYVVLPNNQFVGLINDPSKVKTGDLYAYWSDNGRLYLSGQGFKACEVVKKLIGHKLLVTSTIMYN